MALMDIDLYYFACGHTNGVAVVVLPASRVAHAGDIFAGKSVPQHEMKE